MKVKVNHLPDISSVLGSSRLNKNWKKKYVQKKKVRVKLMAWHLNCHSSCSIFSGPSCAPIQVGLGDCDAIHWIVTARIVEVGGLLWLG